MIDSSISSVVTDLQWKEAVFIAPDADEISATTNASLSAVDKSNSGYIVFTRESGQGGANGITIDGETIFSHGQNETIGDAQFSFGELMAITSYDSNAHDTNKYGGIYSLSEFTVGQTTYTEDSDISSVTYSNIDSVKFTLTGSLSNQSGFTFTVLHGAQKNHIIKIDSHAYDNNVSNGNNNEAVYLRIATLEFVDQAGDGIEITSSGHIKVKVDGTSNSGTLMIDPTQDTVKIRDGGVDTTQLADEAVTNDKILDGTIEGDKLASNFSTSSSVNITDQTSSTSSSTGCLITAGGVGVGENLNVADNLKVEGNTTSTTSSTGCLITTGGLGVGENLNIAGVVGVDDTTDSTSSTTGSFTTAGGLGIAKNLYVGDNVFATSFSTTSDIRLKKNIVEVDNCLDKVKKLRGVNFSWIENDTDDFGVIAQEVEAVAPFAVKENKNGLKLVDYSKLTVLLIQAIKEQQHEIEELRDKVISLT